MAHVRLTTEEIGQIIMAATAVFGTELLRIRLFGSRTDPKKAGGDIDLIFELKKAPVDRFSQTQQLRQDLCSRLGEQKFDLIIRSDDALDRSDRDQIFFDMIVPTSVILWTNHESFDDRPVKSRP